MTIEVISDIDRFAALETEWNNTLKQSDADNPFLTFEWLKSWLDVFGDEVELFVLLALEDSKLRGIAPLAIDCHKQLTFIGYPLNDYSDFIIVNDHPETLEEILRYLLSQKPRWKRIILDQLHQDISQSKRIVTYLRENKHPFMSIASDSCPALVLDDREAARKIYYKRRITTYINWYRKQGDLKYNVYADTDEACRRLEDLFRQHRRRRDLTPHPSPFEHERTRLFFKAFTASMHPKGWVQFSSLTLDNEYLAFLISFEYNNILYLYTISFNTDFAKRSPGQVMLRFLFDYSMERGIERMDLARGDESYKNRFSNVFKQNSRIIIYYSKLAKWSAETFFAFRYSKLVDILYRNKRVQSMKLTFIYQYRKRGLLKAVQKALSALFGSKGLN